MCEQTEISYLDGEVVWVKLGSCFWPGEVVGPDKLPPDVLPSFRKPPIAVVKFFQEDAYEYVKNLNSIYKYNCSRKNEFINKGLYMYRTKHGHMEKFPEDVIRAEAAVGGDITILTRDEFQETKKESYADLFGDPAKKTPMSNKKGSNGRGKYPDSMKVHKERKINIDKPNYKVHILLQGAPTTPLQVGSSETASTPSTSRAGSEPIEENKANSEQPVPTPPSTHQKSNAGLYSCHACAFTTTRLNVLILHNKTHSVTFMPYTPSPVRKKITKTSKSSYSTTKTPKNSKSRPEKIDKTTKKSGTQKRVAEDKPAVEVKKTKTDEEIKISLLADWDIDEDSSDEAGVMVITRSPEVAEPAESPAVAEPAELPEAQVPLELPTPVSKNSEDYPVVEKPETSSDSKYEFCEDEDWPEEADIGRKIPRVKNPRKEDTKSISLDDDEVAKEVAELLNKTTVPELPIAPEPLKVEENFPEPSIVKSPDKKPEVIEEVTNSPENKLPTDTQPPKTIFKTKTFFRSRHSRSQDAIGKYVAEQLNAERMDMSEDINGSEIISSETRSSPPVGEPVKVARLAPKIQLKKMKAEAAQMREKEKMSIDILQDEYFTNNSPAPILVPVTLPEHIDTNTQNDQTKLDSSQENVNVFEETMDDTEENIVEVPVTLDHSRKCCSPKESNSYYGFLNMEVQHTVESECEKDILNKNDTQELETQSIQNKADSRKTDNTEKSKIVEYLPEIESPTVRKDVLEQKPLEYLSPETNDSKKLTNNINEKEPVKQDSEMCEDTMNVDNKEPCNVNENLNIDKITTDIAAPATSPELNQQEVKPLMNESTASAVDALLSVSRETDRVTKIISNVLPEDLFEDDNKDTESPKNINGFIESGNRDNFNLKQDMERNAEDDKGGDELCEETIKDNKINESPTNMSLVIDPEVNTTQDEQNQINDVKLDSTDKVIPENIPSESDLVIAETLINLPSTTIQNKSPEQQENVTVASKQIQEESFISNKRVILETKKDARETCTQDLEVSSSTHVTNSENIGGRFETEHEKSENLNAAQSLVQMSESIEHNINLGEVNTNVKKEKAKPLTYKSIKDHEMIINKNILEQKPLLLATDKNEKSNSKPVSFETSSPKLLKILEEPCLPKSPAPNIITKQVIVPGKEKILNFDVGKSGIPTKSHTQKQKIIIRRSHTPHKNLLNNVSEVTTADKIILSRSNNTPQDGSSVQTYTIQTATEAPSDPNTIVIQQKVRKIAKGPAKLQKIKPHTSLLSSLDAAKVVSEPPSADEAMFDINSMPIVLSDDILTPESIEKMPIVMSDGNLLSNPSSNPQKIVKPKQPVVENEKIPISPTLQSAPKQEFKTLIMNPINEMNKVTTTPNILSKSSKLRGTKMLLIDKTGTKQKIIMTKQASEAPVKEIKPQPPLIQPIAQNTGKTEKFILMPTTTTRQARTQKIVIDPQTGKAHMLVGKAADSPLHVTDNKPVPTKIVPTPSDGNSSGNTVMIITNAQGAQSRILLKPEHEKILFPNKQQPNVVSQLKTVTHRIPANAVSANKTLVTNVAAAKSTTRIVPKQKSAIITSKGQLIVGGRVATTAHNIAPMPEIRPAPKRIISNEPKKLIQTIQKNTSEPLIFFQQKCGAMMQLTAAQFEHLQRTGQIIQKPMPGPPRENKIMLQKTINITPSETIVSNIQKPRIRKQAVESPTPMKKIKQEIAIAPAPTPVPALCPISNTITSTIIPPTLSTASSATASSYSSLDNFEELLPSTAIVRQTEPASAQPDPPAPPGLSDGQLLAVPGEHFGGPAGTFYLCVEDNGTFTPIDNRPLVLENNQLVPMAESVPAHAPPPERRDILEAALANSDVFHGETARDEAPDFRDLNANVSVHCRVSETSTTLNQPIMTPVEVPTKADSEPAVPSNLEDGLAVIGVTPPTVPTSLELPITVTDPRIALKTTDPLSANNYGTSLLPSPSAEMSFGAAEVDGPAGGPMSMPLLTEEEAVGKSMPILTDDVSDRMASSAESAAGSPASPGARDADADDQWPRRLLKSGSDTSEISAEIPLQPKIKLSVSDIK